MRPFLLAALWAVIYTVTSVILGTYGDAWSAAAVGVFAAFLCGWWERGLKYR